MPNSPTTPTIANDDFETMTVRLKIEKTRLDDMIECFLRRPEGIAHIDDIVVWLGRHTKRDLTEAPKETATRCLNDFSSNAKDQGVNGPRRGFAVFERIEPATWRLLTYPERPNLIDCQESPIGDYGFKRGLEFIREKRPEVSEWSRLECYRYLLRTYDDNPAFRKLVDSYNDGMNWALDNLSLA